jgi:hypothetical protein
MSNDPQEVDGLFAILIFTGLWVIALIAQLIGWVSWRQDVLIYGVIIGILIISFLAHRRYRRRQR